MKKLFTFLLLTSIISQSFAQAGTPDNTFGTNGKVITAVGTAADYPFAMAVQSDGKIIVTGNSMTASFGSRWALVRYNTNGTLDNTFGTNGTVISVIGQTDDNPFAIAIQSDGKIVVAGSTYSNSINGKLFALARYNSNGTVDNSFGTNGVVTTAFRSSSPNSSSANAIAIQSNGKIIAGGWSLDENNKEKFAMARYNTDGTLDNTFDGDGKVTTALTSENDRIIAMALQGDGKIVVTGAVVTGVSNGVPTDFDFGLARYNTDGSLDNTFGTNGKVITIIGPDQDKPGAIAIQSDGKIVAGGNKGTSSKSNMQLIRYNTDGNLDNTFNGSGIVTSNDIFGAQAITIQSDGKIVVAGDSYGRPSQDFIVARFTPTGAADVTFNGNGKSTIDFGEVDRVVGMKLFGTRIYVAGYTTANGTVDFALAALQNDATALPLSLTSFTASKQSTTVQLNWKIAKEQSTSSYEVERSTDGQNFRKLGAVNASGTGTQDRAYSFADDISSLNQLTTIYYRLKIVDADGKFTYSKVVVVKLGAIVKGLQILSNPVKNVLYVQATGTNETAILQITDAAGRIVKQEKVQLNGTTSISLNVELITKGSYYLLLQTRDNKEVQPFIKQ